MSLTDHQRQCLDEAKKHPEGSAEWEWRIRAAWHYHQIIEDLPVAEFTEWPPQDRLDRALGRGQIAA